MQRIKTIAAAKSHSMEQEIRESLEIRYANRLNVISRICHRWKTLPSTTAEEIARWQAKN